MTTIAVYALLSEASITQISWEIFVYVHIFCWVLAFGKYIFMIPNIHIIKILCIDLPSNFEHLQ